MRAQAQVLDFGTYFIVTVAGHGDLCRTFSDPLDAVSYARILNA